MALDRRLKEARKRNILITNNNSANKGMNIDLNSQRRWELVTEPVYSVATEIVNVAMSDSMSPSST